MTKRAWVLGLLGVTLAGSAFAENPNTAWQGVWSFKSASERSVDLRAAELIELKQGGRLERQSPADVDTQQIFCNANSETGNRNRGEPTDNVNRQGAGNAAVSGCAVEGGEFTPDTDNTDATDQADTQQFENVNQ